MTDTHQDILALFSAGQYHAAASACQIALAKTPADPELHNLQGLALAQLGQLGEAEQAMLRAIDTAPTHIFHSNLSNIYKAQGKLEAATRHLYAALRIKPNYAEGYNNLASLYYRQGRTTDAIPLLQKAIRLHPNCWEAQFNLANALVKQNAIQDAIQHYQATLALKPDHASAQQNLAMLYVEQKNFEQACPLLEEVARHHPKHAELQAQLAEAYLETGQPQAALVQFKKAIALDANRAEWHHNLAVLLLRNQHRAAAKEHFQQAVALAPNNATAHSMLSALEGTQLDPITQSDYVTELFDQYAGYYNQHVKQQLNYQVPYLMRQALGKQLSLHTRAMRILDIGCGTGLCAIPFRDVAEWLVGMDLSFNMLCHAKALNGYDALCRGNVLDWLPGTNQHTFHCAIAADVLVYINDLTRVFQLVQSCLRPNGWFLFTIEETEQENVVHLPTGRYAHSVTYIQTLAQAHQFKLEECEAIELRTDQDRVIMGRLVVLRRQR